MTVSWLQLPPSSSMHTVWLGQQQWPLSSLPRSSWVLWWPCLYGPCCLRGRTIDVGYFLSQLFRSRWLQWLLWSGGWLLLLAPFSSWPLGSSSDFRLYLAYDVVRWVPKHQVELSFSNLELFCDGREGELEHSCCGIEYRLATVSSPSNAYRDSMSHCINCSKLGTCR